MLVPRQGDVDYVKILDFGLAKLAPETLEVDGEGSGQAITRHGSVFGTPRYMAPEQCVGEEVDGRVDLYALGLIFYEALGGVHPFEAREPRKMIKHQLFTPIPPMKTRAPSVNIPAALEALVLRLVEKPRGKRYASATELLTALAEVCEREGILPLEPSARLAAPRTGPVVPQPGGGRPAGTPARGTPADAMATQDEPGLDETQDVSGADHTQDLPDSDSTQDLPASDSGQDLRAAADTQDLPSGASTRPPTPAADSTQPPAPTADSTQPPSATAESTQPPSATKDSTQPPSVTADSTQPPSASGSHPSPAVPTVRVAVDNVPTQPPLPAGSKEKLTPAARSAPDRRPTLHRSRLFLALIPIALLALLFGMVRLRPGQAPSTSLKSGPAPQPPSGERVPTPPPPASLTQADLDRASAAGAAALLQLKATYANDTRLPHALARAYVAQGNGLEALRWQVKALALSESSVYDGEIMQAATLAMNTTESAEPAIELLERDFGTRGVDVLIALVNKPGLGRAKTRISQSLTQAEVRAHASPAALVAFDLHTATKCEAKRALLPSAAQQGDQRTLLQLKALVTTKGCGALSRRDCWPCLHKDAALRNAIAAITARASLAH